MSDLLRNKDESPEWTAPVFQSAIKKNERETWKVQCGSSQQKV